MVNADEKYHADHRDSLAAFRFAILSFLFPVFIPFTCGTLFMALSAKKTEGKNKHNNVALVLSVIGVTLTLAVVVIACIVTPDNLGFHLVS